MNHAKQEKRDNEKNPDDPYWKRAHHDWKFWVALCLMLIAMVVYIVTLDLSVRPDVPNQPESKQTVP